MDPDSTGPGEQVVVIFLESGSSEAVAAVTSALDRAGFDVYPATADGKGRTASFEYAAARFLAIGLGGEPSLRPGVSPGQGIEATRTVDGMKVLLFPGAAVPDDQGQVHRLTWDPDDEWLRELVEAVRYLERS